MIRFVLMIMSIICTFTITKAQSYNYDNGCLFSSSLFGRLNSSIPDTIMPRWFDTAYIARYSISSSFTPNYAFQINKIDSACFQITGLYLLRHSRVSNTDSITFEVLKREISPNVVWSLDALFTTLVQQPHDYGSIEGEDGTSYYFQNKKNGVESCASTWSPDEHSFIGQVIQLCNILSQYPKCDTISLVDMAGRIDSLRNLIDLQNKAYKASLLQIPSNTNKGDAQKPDYLSLFLDYPYNCAAEDNIKLFLAQRLDTCLTSNTTKMPTIDSLHMQTQETNTTISINIYLKILKNNKYIYLNDTFTFSKRTGKCLSHHNNKSE